jgi:LL-diaminopimelate aminotransferase
LCSPNNPTGATFSFKKLKKWVDFALSSGSLIVFDAAYEAYICENDVPHSIFEIEGARECAIEVCSFSKFAGFTGIRCGWTVIPQENEIYDLWKRRQNTKFNGASYISQVGALAALSEKGEAENKQNVAYYMKNAQKIASFLKRKQLYFVGGKNAPYLWLKIPFKMDSWSFFDYLLSECAVVCTPGVGFGKNGEGFVRLSSFASAQSVDEALRRMERIF